MNITKISILGVVFLSLCSLGAIDMQNLFISSGVKFKTDNVNRGRREGRKTVIPHAELGCGILDVGGIYVGAEAALAVEKENSGNDIAPYVGLTFYPIDNFTVDCGYKHHMYPALSKSENFKRQSNEVYGGISYDLSIIPSIYFYYDFDRKEFATEGKLAYTFDLSTQAISGLAIDLEAKIGYDLSSKPYSMEYVEEMGSKGYLYYGATADVVYSLNDSVSARAGASFEGNAAKKDAWVQSAYDFKNAPKSKIWFSTSVDCKF
ncbi:MAG: hypothetical protein LBI81_02315 [Puniceicoccales bacterium]|jgi:hypothetical protein|nr:hypothetical protein [Puniceicoccales bacterium]